MLYWNLCRTNVLLSLLTAKAVREKYLEMKKLATWFLLTILDYWQKKLNLR